MSINCVSIYREFFFSTVKGAASTAACTAAAVYSVKLGSVFHDWYTQACCQPSRQSLICASYRAADVICGVIVIIAALGMMKIAAAHGLQAPIRNPTIIPTGPQQSQPNGFFQSQQNGGFARYAEDDLQGTHRRPLGNYDPVQWDSGSQSI